MSPFHVRFIVCKSLVHTKSGLEGADNLPENLSGQKGTVCGGAFIHRQGKVYSSDPLEANAVVFNLLRCRITLKAAVKDF